MGRAVKYLFRLAVLALLGLVAYALIADLPPPTRQVEVELAVPAPQPGQQAAEAAPESAAAGPAATAQESPPGIMQE